MMSHESFFLLLYVSVGCCLRLLKMEVPSLVDIRGQAVLACKFDLEEDMLNSVKWYKEELEFFRFIEQPEPHILTFPVEGISLQKDKSNISTVTISPLTYQTSGRYRCEVSTDAPNFKLVSQLANMTVLGLPLHDPKIEGVEAQYTIGSYVTSNCTSSPSHPPAKMDWFINGHKAQHWLLDYFYSTPSEDPWDLEPRTIGLKFQVDMTHFIHGKGVIRLECTASVADIKRSSQVSAYFANVLDANYASPFSAAGPLHIPTGVFRIPTGALFLLVRLIFRLFINQNQI